MKKSKFTDEQIAFALKQAETGMAVEEVCRKMGVSEQPFIVGSRNMEVCCLLK
jgi:putative transposase